MTDSKVTLEWPVILQKYEAKYFEEVLSLFKLNTPVFFHPNEEKDFVEYLEENASTYYIAKINDQIAGACGYHYEDKNIGRISWTLVHPSYKGKGVGQILVNHCLDLMKNNTSKITVWTSNLAFDFYAKFGFQLKKIEKDHWAKDLDLYYMEMDV